jgi:DNA repair exonuclease SbcCD ATPase subunit
MKIKTVKINGIRGFCYCETPHIINLDSKHFFLFGENGTGKSSFFDALEWGLTGDVNETRVRKVGNKSEYLQNKFCSESDIPFVEIIYEYNREERVCKRTLGGNSNCEIKENIENNFIDAKRIEEFVIDTKHSLWNRFARLLGYDSLIKFEEQLKLLRNKANDEYESIKEKLNEKRKQIKDIEEKNKKLESNLEKNLGKNWKAVLESEDKQVLIDELDKLKEKRRNLEDFKKNHIEKINLEKTLKDIENMKKQLEVSTDKIHISRVINEALEYFSEREDIRECPVCGQQIIHNKVFARLKSLKMDLDRVISLDKEEENLKNKLENIHSMESRLKKSVQNYYKDIDFSIDSDKLIAFIDIEVAKIDEKVRILEKQIFLLDEKGKYIQNVENLKEENETLKQLEDEYQTKEKIFEDINDFYNLYEQKYGRVIQDELEEMSKKEITNIYNKITQTKEQYVEYIVIEPNIENHEITFKLKIRGRENLVDAITFLSTGHLRCLGFALLIARVKLNSNNLNFIVIDDPIYSVDHERRYYLIRYLRELAKEGYQLIITTSDRTFFDIIRHQFNGNSFNSYRTFLDNYYGSEIQEVILGSAKIECHPKNYIEKAEKYLKMKDLRAAVLYSRLALETVLSITAKEIKLKIPYNEFGKIGVKVFVDSEIEKKLKEKYNDQSNEIEQKFQNLSDNRYFGHLLNKFPPNQEVHFPHDSRISYVYDEIKDLIDIVKDFTSFLLNLINKNKI